MTARAANDNGHVFPILDIMFSIAFICTANVCRSVMAHAICVPESIRRGWPVQVYSGGTMDFTGTPPAIPAWFVCCQNNTPPQKDASTFVRDLPLAAIDRFFVMEREHVRILVEDHGISSLRVSLLGSFDPKSENDEIEDPINKGSIEFSRCYARVRRCIMHYLDTTAEIPATVNQAAAP